MSLRTVLIAFLFCTASCDGGSATGNAKSDPVDRRFGLARLDSCFSLNDPHWGFDRPPAKVSLTPPAIRDRFRNDLIRMFGQDPEMRAQLDSSTQIVLLHPNSRVETEVYILHVADLVVGDRYLLYLQRGDQISPEPWQWYGPAPQPSDAPAVKGLTLAEVNPAGYKTLTINEWRHNGNVYSAWVQTTLEVRPDLGLRQEFRFEPYATVPGPAGATTITRELRYIPETDRYLVRAWTGDGKRAKSIGSVELARNGAGWKIFRRDPVTPRDANSIWSSNPLGEEAIFNTLPEAE